MEKFANYLREQLQSEEVKAYVNAAPEDHNCRKFTNIYTIASLLA